MVAGMSTPLPTRIRLKIKRIARELVMPREERRFNAIWAKVDPIEGWLYRSHGKWLFDASRSLPERATLVEIGSFKGRSTCCLGLGCLGSEKHIFAIDSFDGGPDLPKADSLQDFLRNLQRCEVSEYVEPVVGLSAHIAKAWNRPIDMLFVDGSHSYEDVLADFNGFFPHVVPGGIVACHDVVAEWPGVLRAWNDTIKRQLTETGNCEGLGYGRKPGESAVPLVSPKEGAT
jgi:hypothetical protein